MPPPTKKRRTESGSEEDVTSGEEVSESSSDEEMQDGEVEGGDQDKNQEQTVKGDLKPRKGSKNVASAQEKARAIGEMYEYKSNVFRMEIDELLSEVRLDYRKKMAPVEKALYKLKSVIDGIPEKLDLQIGDVEREMGKRKVHLPFPEPKPAMDVKYKFSYTKPAYINVAGSYALKAIAKQSDGFAVDLVLQMPSTIFQEKDYLNYRYFHKRAYYLASIAAELQDSRELGLKLSYSYLHDDLLRPILVASPSGDGGEFDFTVSKCLIRIIPALPKDTFTVARLLPSKNCVRPSGEDGSAILLPTPEYNSSLLADTGYFTHLTQLHESASSAVAFKDACLLGRTWLKQRGFGSNISRGGFGHFEWAMLMSLILKGGGHRDSSVLASGYSNYQMFKAMLQFLASRDLIGNPLLFGAGKEGLGDLKGPIVFDGELGLNLLFKMTEWGYKLLKHEAELTLHLLNDSVFDHFDAVFLDRFDDSRYKFDSLAHISIPSETTGTNSTLSYARKLYNILTQGLRDRVRLIHLTLPPTSSRPVEARTKRISPTPPAGRITLGILLDAAHSNRLVDHGPAAGHKEGASYRDFWGSKAELRRFKDGSILESVLWTAKDSKLSIHNQIIQYLVGKFFGKDIGEAIEFVGEEFGNMLDGGRTSAAFQPTMTAFDNLIKELRDLEGLPLAIRQVAAAAPGLRYATVEAPLGFLGQLMEPADVVVQFESSGRWPDDLVAIQKTKIAFLLKMSSLLEKTSGAVTRIGLENVSRPTMNSAALELIYRNGPAFRIRIYHDREQTLLERQLLSKDLSGRKRDEIDLALSEHRRRFIIGPLHTQEVQKLSHRFPALSPSIRLVKKWFRAHLLSGKVSDELMELLTIRSFVSSPSPPNSVMAGFLQTLRFISVWDWRTEPVVVGPVGKSALENFEAIRKADPGMNRIAMVAFSEYDTSGTTWTELGPKKVVAARITALARSAITANIKNMFAPSLKEYDFVLHLEPRFTVSKLRTKVSKYKNIQKREATDQDIAKLGLNVVDTFLEELFDIYGDNIVFFTDGEVVGGLWNPSATVPRRWKVKVPYSTIPSSEEVEGDEKDEKLSINQSAIMNEIGRLGAELISRMETNR